MKTTSVQPSVSLKVDGEDPPATGLLRPRGTLDRPSPVPADTADQTRSVLPHPHAAGPAGTSMRETPAVRVRGSRFPLADHEATGKCRHSGEGLHRSCSLP